MPKFSAGPGLRARPARAALLAATFALLALPGSAFAGNDSWTSVGPAGGSIWALAIDPRAPSTMYAGAWRGGVFKSTDAGASWAAVGPFDQMVFSIVVDPKDSRVVYAGAYDGLFKSGDAGQTWQLVDGIVVPYPHIDTGPPAFLASQAQAIVFDPRNPSTIYMGTANDVFVSVDDGITFTAVQAPFYWIQDLALSPRVPGLLLAGAGLGQGLFKTVDAGKTWGKIASLAFSVNRVAFDPRNGSIAYAATDGGLYKSSDSGDSWSPLFLSSGAVKDLLIDAQNPQRLVACSELYSVYESHDGGVTWGAPGYVAPSYIYKLAMPAGTTRLYAATDSGVFQSGSASGPWTPSSRGLNASLILSLAVSEKSPMRLFAGTAYEGLLRSMDGGGSWQTVPLPADNEKVVQISIDPQDDAAVFAMGNSGVFKSSDGGDSWVLSLSVPASEGTKALVMSPSDPRTLYFASGPYYQDISHIFKTSDSGGHWLSVTDLAVDVASLFVDPRNPQILLAGTNTNNPTTGGVLKSLDGGASWAPANGGFPPFDLPRVDWFASDPKDPSLLYAAAAVSGLGGTRGVFKSTDGGFNWTGMSQGITNLYIFVVAVHPANSSVVLAGTDKGLFVSQDAGASWAPMNEGLIANASVRSIVFSAPEGKVRIATFGGGVFERQLSYRARVIPSRTNGPQRRPVAVSPR